MEVAMRSSSSPRLPTIIVGVLACATTATATLVLSASTARAEVTYPWCAEYTGRDFSATNCGFMTEQQCQWTISGIGGYCHENLFYQKPVEEPVRPRKKRTYRNRTQE
jgi:hypothetical protein